jgi:hypothetical protein
LNTRSLFPWLAVVCFIAAILYCYRGVTEAIEYDGYWHIWVGAQNDWHQFNGEYRQTSHPPLFFLLLKLVMAFQRTPLAFRLVSILSGIGAVFVLGKVAGTITRSVATAALASVLFAFSTPVTMLATEVRSYMLALLWIELAFYNYVRVWQTGGSSKRPIVWFGVFSGLGILSHYFVSFFLLASLTAPVYLAAVNKDFRRTIAATLRKGWAAIAGSVGAVSALAAYLYYQQARSWAVTLNHLPAYYYEKTKETIPAFLWRTTEVLLDSFLPFPVATEGVYILSLIVVVMGLAYVVYRFHLHSRWGLAAAFPAAFLMIVAAGLALAAILDKYPYGGAMRQQSILFPFLVLTAALVVRDLAKENKRALAATAGIVAASFLYTQAMKPYVGMEGSSHPADVFRAYFPAPDAVFTDRFSFFPYFVAFDDRDWAFLGDTAGTEAYRPTGTPLVLRNIRWNFTFADPSVYTDIRQLMEQYHLRSVSMFCIQQFPYPGGNEAEVVRATAATAGLLVDKIQLDGRSVYATFVPAAPATPVQAAVK